MIVRALHVVGTRPNFMKVAPIMRAIQSWNLARACEAEQDGGGASLHVTFEQILVHTGQHYDERMSKVFFEDLAMPVPDYYLEVGSGSHAEQTAQILLKLEPILLREAPSFVVVVGDVNSTLAAALAATKLNVPVVHVESGLRSGDREMPEEINRIVVDHIADLLLTTSADANVNLLAEGIPDEHMVLVGNPMIDSLEASLDAARRGDVLTRMGLHAGSYALVTLHRPSNVDGEASLHRLVDVLEELGEELTVVFPVHARTSQRLSHYGLSERLEANPRVVLTPPMGYLDFVGLLLGARIVLTDSGGIQEETTVLGVPCLTLRPNTERPVTVTHGTNRLVDPSDHAAICTAARAAIAVPDGALPQRPELWDGLASERIVAALAEWVMRLAAEDAHSRGDRVS